MGRLIPAESRSISEQDAFLSRSVEDALSLSNVRGEIELISSDVAVRALRDVFWCGSSAQMGRALGILPSQIVHFCAGTFPAPLLLFVRASYATGATMAQMFVSNRFEVAGSVERKPDFEVQRSVPRRLQLAAELVRRLNDALAEGGHQSVGAVAAGLNVTAATVWRRERELATRLAQMHAEYASKETQAQKEIYQADVIAFIAECAARGIAPGRRQVDKECGGIGRFSTDWKRSIIKDAMSQVATLPPRSGE
ncbi:PqqD family protein [Paraburkholderia tuberum]|nr:PqqD family protein [Paraburkholderia tuberum]